MPKKFADSVPVSMLDDQKALMHAQPLDASGNIVALPAGAIPSYSVDNTALLTLDPSVDPTGLSCEVLGIKGAAGTATVTVSLTNADGTVATGSAVFTTTLDPAELDVASMGISVDAPVHQ